MTPALYALSFMGNSSPSTGPECIWVLAFARTAEDAVTAFRVTMLSGVNPMNVVLYVPSAKDKSSLMRGGFPPVPGTKCGKYEWLSRDHEMAWRLLMANSVDDEVTQ